MAGHAAVRLALPARVARRFEAAEIDRLVELRRELHRDPELSFREERTAQRLERALRQLGPSSIERVAGTGLVARVSGRDPAAPLVAVRGDIDALPIQEDTGLSYASQNAGVMHACGHDVHATWAVAAAGLLSRDPAAGDVLIVLQPAEELGLGAPAVLETGVLAGVQSIFGAHVDRRFAVGEVVVQPGPLAAAADEFVIELVGQGAHGARPHLGHDPVVAAASIVQALQTVVSRRNDPGSPAVVTVGELHAGTAPNVIPETARLSGTLRSTTPETRTLLEEEVRHIATAAAHVHHVEARVTVRRGTPPIVNDERESRWVEQVAIELLGGEGVLPLPEVNMGGEDFSFYMETIPGCFFRVGAREAGGLVIGAHTPRFHAADEAIFVGGAVLADAARLASAQLACL